MIIKTVSDAKAKLDSVCNIGASSGIHSAICFWNSVFASVEWRDMFSTEYMECKEWADRMESIYGDSCCIYIDGNLYFSGMKFTINHN